MHSLYVTSQNQKNLHGLSSSCHIMSEIKIKKENKYGNRKNKHHGQRMEHGYQL